MQITLDLYKAAMRGLRKHLVTRLHTLNAPHKTHYTLSVIDAMAERGTGEHANETVTIEPRTKQVELEHLMCFVPGLLTLGECVVILHAHTHTDTRTHTHTDTDTQMRQLSVSSFYVCPDGHLTLEPCTRCS